MRVTAKICGVTAPDVLDSCIAGAASHVGFVFFAKSPRNISGDAAAALATRAAGRVGLVGLFVDPDPETIDAVLAHVKLDVLQLHGAEPPADAARLRDRFGLPVWKAVAIRTSADLAHAAAYRGAADRIVYDAKPADGAALPGGNGMRFDWRLIAGYHHPLPWMLSGGLDAQNVAEAVSLTSATLVDVSSGVETAPGHKSVDKIATFLQAVSQL